MQLRERDEGKINNKGARIFSSVQITNLVMETSSLKREGRKR